MKAMTQQRTTREPPKTPATIMATGGLDGGSLAITEDGASDPGKEPEEGCPVSTERVAAGDPDNSMEVLHFQDEVLET